MAAAVAGEILGPRPGRAICSFWQGGMEMTLRIIAPVVRPKIETIKHHKNLMFTQNHKRTNLMVVIIVFRLVLFQL